ncbi:MAG: sulfurtransferase TusA family protein [Deltaproteobacteria bacterium]|nr:sulfurtransferase TusA family protein [Deltaproteobacteria bacterium]
MTKTADQMLDAKGLSCPMPLMKLSKLIRTMTPGQVLRVEATDPCFKPDAKAWCEMTGNEIEFSQDGQTIVALVTKK